MENTIHSLPFAARIFWTILFVLIIGIIFLARSKKKKGEDYQLVLVWGIVTIFVYLVISAYIAVSLISPIYNLSE